MAQGAAVATAQGLGASVSATLAGVIIVTAGYSAALLTLAAIALGGLALYAVAMPETLNREVSDDATTPSAVRAGDLTT